MSLTASQARAVETDGTDLCVRAGAGSGKTRVLVERAVRLVTREEDPVPLSQILAITFTEKAAREMKERLAAELAKREFPDARAEVERSFVSTIHGFCARLLRENAVEAAVDPAFEVLDEFRWETLLRTAMEETVSEWTESRPDDLDALARLGFVDPALETTGLHASLRAAGIAPRDLPVPEPDPEALPAALGSLVDALDSLQAQAPEVTVHRPDIAELRGGEIPFAEARRRLAALSGSIKLRGPAKEALREIRETLVPRVLSLCAEEFSRPALLALRSFVSDFHDRYTSRKTEAGMLDFSDLELRARNLLAERPEVRDRLAERFRQILVDEYQDVNQVQADVIALLRGAGDHFAVGDVKQSIYGFRHAEPRLFAEYAEEVGEEGRVELLENFRSGPGLVSFANRCFSRLFAGGDLVTWSDMIAAGDFEPADAGSVEVLLHEGDLAADFREHEARAIARRIREIVDREEIRIARAGDRQGEPVRFQDIAVLFRALTDVKIYERAFEQNDVPYYVVKGRGFYQAREVVDLIRMLRVVRNPRDEVSLAAALRSPFAGITDDGLAGLVSHARKRSGSGRNGRGILADLLSRPEEVRSISDPDRARWLDFARLLDRLRQLSVRGTIREVVETAITASGYGTAVWLLPGARRRAANLKKAVALAEAYSGVMDLGEFLAVLRDFHGREVRETEAPTGGEAEDVVRILTVHAAKGLEFPVVFLPDLSRVSNVPAPPLLCEGGRVGVKVTEEVGRKSTPTATFLHLTEERKRREEQEALRLLYVGVTRAEEHLVLSAWEGKKGQKNGSFWKTLSDVIDLEAMRVVRPEAEEPARKRRRRSLVYSGKEALARGRPLEVAGEEQMEWARELLDRAALPRPDPDGTSYENTVSELLVFSDCPLRHRLSYGLGIPELPFLAESESREEPAGLDELPPRESGIAVHEVLRIWEPAGDRPLADVARECVAGALGRESEGLAAKVTAMAQSFYDSPCGVEVLGAAEGGVRREVPFLVRVAGLILRGKIDLLHLRPGGRWRVVDYKTGDTPIAKYQVQLLAYARAVTQFLGQAPEAGIVRLRAGVPAEYESCRVDDESLAEAEAAMRRFSDAMRAEGPFHRGEDADCGRCAFREFCPEAVLSKPKRGKPEAETGSQLTLW